jgi:hypothetical protein
LFWRGSVRIARTRSIATSAVPMRLANQLQTIVNISYVKPCERGGHPFFDRVDDCRQPISGNAAMAFANVVGDFE